MTIARRQSTHVETPWPIWYACVYQVYIYELQYHIHISGTYMYMMSLKNWRAYWQVHARDLPSSSNTTRLRRFPSGKANLH